MQSYQVDQLLPGDVVHRPDWKSIGIMMLVTIHKTLYPKINSDGIMTIRDLYVFQDLETWQEKIYHLDELLEWSKL